MGFIKWTFWGMCWVILILSGLLVASWTSGCTTTSIEKEYRMVREMRDANCEPEIVKVSWERQTFELACK